MHRARVSYRSWLTTQLPGAKGCCRLTQHPGAKGCRRLTQHPGAKLCHRLDKTDFMERKKGVSKWQKLPFNKSRIEINEWARNSSLDLQVRTSPCPVPTQGSHSWEIGNDGVASSGKEGAGGSSSKPGDVEGVTTVPVSLPRFNSQESWRSWLCVCQGVSSMRGMLRSQRCRDSSLLASQ